MFRIESYITPIIIKYVEKYVKNIRPQELQLSMWGGEVAFQNLDLRLDVLEDELNLPFNFLSGHIHEIIIKLPWTKIASESVTVTINTIEFVLKLKDLSERTPVVKKKEKKKKISRDDELQTPPGYMANLVNKIANNISIKCNNVILKYIEEDIVVSMNIQQVSFDAADDLWNPAFVDTSPIKVLLRKIVNIQDLTICLDKRNASGKIEVCQEPILYRSTFEIRLLMKSNLATAHRSSITRIDIHTKALHLNISTQQFPMIMRLVILMMNLKQGNLKTPHASGNHFDNNDDEASEETNESFFSWAWNMLPSIFPSEEEDDRDEDIKGHVLHAGIYVDQFKVSFKSQEIFGDPIVYATKKIKYVPFLKMVFSGIYFDTIMLGSRWFNMRGGITDISMDSVGDCTCGAKQDSVSIFTTFNNAQGLHYKNTLIDSDDSEENLSRIHNYIFDWDSHIANINNEKLLAKTPAIAFDMVHQVEIPDDYSHNSDLGSDLEYSNLSEKTLYRILVGRFQISYSTTLIHIIETIQEYVNLYDYPPYVAEKAVPSLVQLTPPSTDDYDALMSEIPTLMYHVSLANSIFEISMCDHKKPSPTKKSSSKPQIMLKNKNKVSCILEIGKINMKCILPLYQNRLVYTTCQLPEPPAKLFEACYYRLSADLKNTIVNLKCNEIKFDILSIPTIDADVKVLIRPDLWLKEEIQEINANLIIKNISLYGNRPQIALLTTFLTQNNDEWVNNTTALSFKLIAELTDPSLLKTEINLNEISVKALQNKVLYSAIFKIENCFGHDQKYLFLSSQGQDPFIQLVAQFPKSLRNNNTPPVLLCQLSEIVVNINSNIIEFLNWSSKSDDTEQNSFTEEANIPERIIENTPKKTLDAKIIRKYSNKLDSIHSSSEKDTTTTVIKPDTVKPDPVKTVTDTDWSKYFSLCNCTILNVELKQITIYTTNCDFKSATDISLANVLLTYPESDILILKLPNVLISSSHLKSNYGLLNSKMPLEFPPAIWNKDRDGFPWNMSITDFSILTVQNLIEYMMVNPIKTNISLAITLRQGMHPDNKSDEPPFSVFLHIDTSATCMNLYENQLKLLLSTLNIFLSLDIMKSSSTKPHETSPPLEIAQRPVSPDSTVDLKEFLGISHIAESAKDSITVVDSQNLEEDTKLCPQIPILLQWTLTKFSIQLFSSTDVDNYKLAVDFEDIISSVDRQLIYTKLKAKIGSISCEFYEKKALKETWILNESFGFNIRTDQNTSTNPNTNTFFDMTITKAETGNVHSKWGTNKKDQSLNDFLTEIMINMQQIDIRIEFELMAKFLPILNVFGGESCAPQKPEASSESLTSISVADLPLIYFESKGIRVFIPTENNQKNCNVCIIKINQIIISPNVDNPVTRIPVRPDIYTKAAQLRILNSRGSKIEDRQYEFILKGISMATGNWKELSTFIEHTTTASLHDNPAFEWNNKQNIKHTLDINTVFKDFDFSMIYAPAIIYRNVLVCGPALELNCITDLLIDLNSPQINLGSVIFNKILSITTASPQLKPCKRTEVFESNARIIYRVVSSELNLPKKARYYGIPIPSESISTENLLTDSGIGSQKNEKRNKYGKKPTNETNSDKIKKSSIVPFEVCFVGGVFTINLYHVQNRKVETEKDTVFYPILNISIHQPNAMITQTIFERTVQMSIFDVKVCLGSDPELLKKTNNKFADVLFQTKQGDLDSHGIPQPLIKVRLRNNIIRDSDLEVEWKRPIKVSLSHKIVEKIYSLQLVFGEFCVLRNPETCYKQVVKPIKNNYKMKTIRTYLYGIKRINICTTQILLKIYRANEYNFNISFIKLQSKFEVFDRPEKFTFNMLLKGLMANTNEHIILHPFTVDVFGNMFQEMWNKNPSLFFTLKSNCLQVNLCPKNIINILKLKHSFLRSLRIIRRRMELHFDVTTCEQIEFKCEVQPAHYIQIPTPKFNKKMYGPEEYYQDDLRAGAFQFIEAHSENDIPLPYQILIINVKDSGIICWRYPQPRTLNHIKVYPVPFHTTTGINIKCKLEYYSDPHAKFLSYCDFELSEVETKILELPRRKVTSSIWRVIMVQSMVAVNSEYFDDTEDLENELFKRNLKIKNINEILMKQTPHVPEDYLDDSERQSLFHLHPKALVACMQVDSCFNPSLVPNIQTVISITQIRLNLVNNVDAEADYKNPNIFKNHILAGEIPQTHIFLNTHISDVNLHMNMFDDMNMSLHSEFNLQSEIIDYAFLTQQSLIDNFNVQFYMELNDEIILNLMTSDIKLRYGPSIGHTLSVANQLWRQILTDEYDSRIIVTRFVICNETVLPLYFGQAETDEVLALPPKSYVLYAFRSEGLEQKLCFVYDDDVTVATSNPIHIGLDGIQFGEFLGINKYFTVKTEKLSSSQKKIMIKGQTEFLNMTMQNFTLTYKNQEGLENEYSLDKKSLISLIGISDNDVARIKMSDSPKWSGYIPIKSSGKNNIPWLVKVPTTNPDKFISFWIRVIKENFPDDSIKPNGPVPQRVLITIWPLFMVRSLLTIDAQVETFMNDEREELTIPGRGETTELILHGTHENEHELVFMNNISASCEEDKKRALLSYNLVDKNKFFEIPSKYSSIDKMQEELEKPIVSNWPCSREEELRWNRIIITEEDISPMYNCSLSQELSCSLMLSILPWCLFINSTCTTIQLTNNENGENYSIYENVVSMPFMISSGFTLSILEASSWKTSPVLYLKSSPKTKPNEDYLVIPEEGNTSIDILTWEGNSKFVLSSTNENGVKILTLSAYYVVTNFTKYNLNGFLYSIFKEEKQDLTLSVDTSPIGLYNFPPNDNSVQNCYGTPINNFYNLSLNKSISTKHSYFASIRSKDSNIYSCPINISNPFNRKSICVTVNNEPIPLSMSLIEYNSQMYLSVYEDHSPTLEIINMTDLRLYIAQSDTIHPSGHALALTDCLGDNFKWYQTIDKQSRMYYTPLGIDSQFPEIKTNIIAILFGLVTETNTIHWSQPIQISETKNIFLKIPKHGDVKIMIDCDYEIIKLYIQNISETQEFCVRDIRSRLVNRPVTHEIPILHHAIGIGNSDNNASDIDRLLNIVDSSSSINSNKMDSFGCTRQLLQKHEYPNQTNKNIRVNCYLSEVTLILFNDYDKKLSLKSEILSIHFNNITVMYDKLERFINFNCFNFQIDNLRYETKLYDFPVILCSQEDLPKISLNNNSINVFSLDYNIQKILNNKQLLNLFIKFYQTDMKMEKININVYPIRAYLEDTFLNYAIDFVLESLPFNLIYNDNTFSDGSSISNNRHRITLHSDRVILIPQLIEKQSLNLSETFKLKTIKIEALSILLSVHTSVRMYIALDHSPLQFSIFERHNLNTLPMKLGYVLGKHYLEGAAIGAGWVVGSLEILGSPSGLARSFSIGIRDFVSMPMQGLFRGPWGFLVGLTQGSASLIRNITAGTVNSVSKLAASVSRNLDWLTHDEEHLMITDSIRRSRPQGVTEGFTQGLTGFGISLLGAVGGLARHPLEAKSTAGVFAGVGKGIVGAFTKPLSGAAELVALTGQGVLHSVGYNTLPSPRSMPAIKSATLHPSSCKLSWKMTSSLLSEDRILFSSLVTLNWQNGYKPALLCLTSKIVTFLSIDRDEIIEILSIDKIKPLIDINDLTLISLKTIRQTVRQATLSFDAETMDASQLLNESQRSLFVSPRTYQFVRDSNEQLTMYSSTGIGLSGILNVASDTDVDYPEEKLDDRIEFYIAQHLGEYFIRYLSIIKRSFTSNNILYNPLELTD